MKVRFLQEHHLLGENHDPEDTVPICRNCHYLAGEGLLQADVSMLAQPNTVARVATMLRGVAVHHEMLASTFRGMATTLEELEKTQ